MDDFHVYQVAENLVRSTTPVSFQSSRGETSTKRASTPSNYSVATPPPMPPLVSQMPSNAVVIHPSSPDESFHDYIDHQFEKDADILKAKLQLENNDPSRASPASMSPRPPLPSSYDPENPSTLWAVIHGDQTKQQQAHGTAGFAYASTRAAMDDAHLSYDRPWWSMDQDDGLVSIGMFLFVFGFVLPPLWWIGAIFPRHSGRKAGKMASRWKILNRFMSLGFSILLIIAIIVLAVLYSQGAHSSS
ncbi:hypothetical protein BC940DRAFT_305867 [Gongronella butleri]|nr:hypothetical protein BC940DRAFT_305867 [Gongronella butleri]